MYLYPSVFPNLKEKSKCYDLISFSGFSGRNGYSEKRMCKMDKIDRISGEKSTKKGKETRPYRIAFPLEGGRFFQAIIDGSV
ncbi:MAG: hypothetical protein Q4D98_01350 [Planctomycetia bacterium]|nr:hypothetical protein [Planctomycetia bacterium]